MMEHEQANSPYEAPRTGHLDDAPEVYQPHLFSARGRIGRARFIAYTWWTTFVVAFFCSLLLALFGGLFGGFGSGNPNTGVVPPTVMYPWMFVVGAVTYLPMLVMAKRRLNDMNLTGWLAVLVFAPFVNAIFLLFLVLWPGQAVANRYGPPPAANGVLVWVFGVGLPVLFFLGVFAAVFLPYFGSGELWNTP
ncbi:MAG: DUF805 domain-containing protein [Ketobacteraceae bacterium]|nr:DUF805 domain-containing protein [Ketobacteraceae bacterium]